MGDGGWGAGCGEDPGETGCDSANVRKKKLVPRNFKADKGNALINNKNISLCYRLPE